jgi:hypothetical protein
MDVSSILSHHYNYHTATSHRSFVSGDTLAYVTPWNGRGYDIAKRFAAKFTYVSPVWYQIKIGYHNKQFSVTIGGTHDVDQSWIRQLRTSSPSSSTSTLSATVPLVVPRFLVEANSEAITLLASNKKVQSSVISKILDGI